MGRRLTALMIGWCLVAPAMAQRVQLPDEVVDFDQREPAAGFWLGSIDAPQGALFAIVEFKREGGEWAGTMTLLAYGAVNAACSNLSVQDREIQFAVSTALGAAKFKGVLSEDGQRMIGQIVMPRPQADGALESASHEFEFRRSLRAAAQPSAKAYGGKLDVPQIGQLALTVILAQSPGGNWIGQVDVPGQMLLGFPLVNIEVKDGGISAMLPIPGFPAIIDATMDGESHQLVGRFKQGTFDLELNLAHDAGYVAPTLRRPQHPQPPFAYESTSLRIPVAEGVELAGTLTIPGQDVAPPPHALAILISGSGQQDRDETVFGHKPFLVMSDYLTRHGIAVFRYDDRGVGESGGLADVNQCTSKDFARDVSVIVDVLKQQPQIDATRIGLIGHSEGGMIAPMVAADRDDLAFIVLLAAPGVPGKDILLKQGGLMLKAEGADDAAIASFAAQQKTILAAIEQGADDDQIRSALEEATKSDPQPDDGAKDRKSTAIEAQLPRLNTPWLKYFIAFDPRPTLAKVKCPVLAVNGTLDLQIWHEQNLPEIEKAVAQSGGDVTIKRYDGLNHLFQPATTGGLSEYAMIETTFDEQVMRDVLAWLNAKIGAGTLP